MLISWGVLVRVSRKIVFALSLFASAATVLAQSNAPGAAQSFDSAAIAKKIAPAVVLIRGTTDKAEILGSGFILSPDGKIATNVHVIQDMRKGGVQLASGEKYDSFSILAFDQRKDIALIKIAGFDLPTVTLGNSNTVQVGEPVLVVGSPHGLQGSVSTGVISAIRDDPTGGFKVLQTDAAVNPGNSGGPMVNRQAEVVGVIRSKITDAENLNFAIPVNYLSGLMGSQVSSFSLEELRARLSGESDVFKSDTLPTRWKSLVSGATKMVRRDGDRIYVETLLSDDEKNAGCFQLSEFQKKGDLYTGTDRRGCVCEYTRGFGAYSRTYSNKFVLEYDAEITKLEPTRIEGRVKVPPAGTKIDCRHGTSSKPPSEWEVFTWIPE